MILNPIRQISWTVIYKMFLVLLKKRVTIIRYYNKIMIKGIHFHRSMKMMSQKLSHLPGKRFYFKIFTIR